MEKVYVAKPWSPHINEVAEKLMKDIHNILPDVGLFFMGATALKIPGKNDIDLDITTQTEKIPEYTRELIPVLGEPKEQKENIASWSFYIDDIEIDIILSDPKFSHVPEQKKVFETLKSDPKLLEEYKQLKIDCNGIPYKEYEKKKIDFFHNKVLKDNNE